MGKQQIGGPAEPNILKIKEYAPDLEIRAFDPIARCFMARTQRNETIIILASDHNGKGWHISASLANRLPTYEELKEIRYRLAPGNITMAMIFPPKEEFVNLHEFCHHLHQIPGEKERAKWRKA